MASTMNPQQPQSSAFGSAFGGSAPNTGQMFPSSGFGIGNVNSVPTASPFGQSGFGQPAAPTMGNSPSVFGQPSFTAQPSAFGLAMPTQQQSVGFGTVASNPAAPPAFGSVPMNPTIGSTQGIAQPTAGAFGGLSTTPSQLTFGVAPNANQPATQPTVNNAFNNNNIVGDTTGFGGSGNAITQTGVYSDDAMLTPEEKEAFAAPVFTLENIPTKPPSKMYV